MLPELTSQHIVHYIKQRFICHLANYIIPGHVKEPVLSPGRGLAGFPQEKLTWHIKSQEDDPVWVQRQATCQTDFRVGTLE